MKGKRRLTHCRLPASLLAIFLCKRGDGFVRHNTDIFMLSRSTRPTRDGSNAVRPETPGFWRELCRYAVPSSVSGLTTACDTITRPINGARPSGQHTCCSKTSLTFLSDVAQAFAASLRLILSPLSPQHNFLRRRLTKSAKPVDLCIRNSLC